MVTLAGPARPRLGTEMRELGVIPDGAMLVRNGRIAAVGTRSEIERLVSPDTEIVDARGGVVMPGFVDAHTHPVFAGNRAGEFEMRCEGATYQEISAAGGGILSTVRKTRAASEEELLEAGRRYKWWFLRGGTTTVEAKSGYGLSVEDECKILRVIRQLGDEGLLRYVPTFLGAHEVPDEYAGRPDEYLDLVIGEMLPRVVREGLARWCDVFCEPTVFGRDQARRVLRAARAAGLGLRVHADQFAGDYGSIVAAECGAVTADHLESTGELGRSALAKAGVMPVLLPGSVYALGLAKYADARALIRGGMPVVLATDFNPGSSPVTSMPLIISMACTQMRMTPAEGITAATINAAYSLGLGGEVGSLEVAKAADFVIHDCGDWREIPYFIGVDGVAGVWVSGVRAVQSNNF